VNQEVENSYRCMAARLTSDWDVLGGFEQVCDRSIDLSSNWSNQRTVVASGSTTKASGDRIFR